MQGGDGCRQEQGGRAVPVRRVAVCGPGGGKIDDRVAVQAPAGAGRCKHPLGLEVQPHGISDCPIQAKVREAHVSRGVNPLHGLRQGYFYMHSHYHERKSKIKRM